MRRVTRPGAEPERKLVERQTTMDDLLRPWERLKEQRKAATIEDLSAEIQEDPAELRERLQAVASMMSLLGMGTESGSLGSRSIGETTDGPPAAEESSRRSE